MKALIARNYDHWRMMGSPAGTLIFYNDQSGKRAGAHVVCPCGCSGMWGVSFGPGKPSWAWDGNEAEPTFSPSLRTLDSDEDGKQITHWHGFIRKGIFETCPDSPKVPLSERP